MINRVAAVLLLLTVSLCAMAQADTSHVKPSWFMTVSAGALFARKAIDTAPSASMTQGLRYKRFAFGVGVGYDAYKDWQALPVFTSVSYDFVKGSGEALYVQIEGGYSSARSRRGAEAQLEDRNAGGYFYHPALGFRVGQGKVNLDIRIGYKIQNLESDATPEWWDGWNPSRITISQQMERLSFSIGIGLR